MAAKDETRGTGLWKVGELAKRTGISVRTLHYYEEIGLLTPGRRTESGYRLYTEAEIARLQQIRSLQQLGLPLAEIRDCLGRPGFSPREVIERQLARLRGQIALQQALCRRLEAIAARLAADEEVSVEEMLSAMEGMTRMEKYYTPEQMKEIEERGRALGEEGIRRAEAEWAELIAAVRAEMEKGTDPRSETVQRLAVRWMELVNAFTGGNPGIEQGLNRMWNEETQIHGIDTGPMREMGEYLARARKG